MQSADFPNQELAEIPIRPRSWGERAPRLLGSNGSANADGQRRPFGAAALIRGTAVAVLDPFHRTHFSPKPRAAERPTLVHIDGALPLT